MATPLSSPPPLDAPSATTIRKTRQTTRLSKLTSRSLDQPRPTVNVNPITHRGSGPHKEKFHNYLGVVARKKIPIVYLSWKVVPESLKNIIWDEILDSDHNVSKPVGRVDGCIVGVAQDPLGELMKILYDIYQKPMELPWDGMKFGLPNVEARFFITVADVAEFIIGDKCLNISILQLWMTFMEDYGRSRGHGSVYGFLEVHWQLVVLCPRENIVVWFCSLRKKPDVNIKATINSAMKTITITFKGMFDQAAPWWIEPKSHLQTRGYECGYYVMHRTWYIVTGGLKDEWSKLEAQLSLVRPNEAAPPELAPARVEPMPAEPRSLVVNPPPSPVLEVVPPSPPLIIISNASSDETTAPPDSPAGETADPPNSSVGGIADLSDSSSGEAVALTDSPV
ncbi:hypothetical protein JHK82_050427 [Glycine max]|nr:hypothetical protein JHK85_051064 [Glycine max]KAG5091649.1 hypothetical protein JHK82_050427 [Glycine max]